MDGGRKMRGSRKASGVLAAGAAVFAALLVAGCGGGGDPTGTGAAASNQAPLTKAAFIKRGDAICAAVPGEFQKRLTALETAVAALAALPPPEGEELQAQTIVRALEKAIDSLERNPSGELAGPKSPFAEFQRLTRQYGFKACSQL